MSPDERLRLAADPHTDPAILAMLAEDHEHRTLNALAENPATPAALLETFVPRSWLDRTDRRWRRLGLSVTRNPAAPPDLLRRLYEYFMSTRPPVSVTPLAGNPNTPPDIRAYVAARHLLVNPCPVSALAVASDGSWLAAAGTGHTVLVWDPATGAVRHTLPCTGDRTSVSHLMTVPGGRGLAAAESSGIVRLWDPVAGTAAGALPGDSGTVRALVAAPDGSWLAGAGVSADHRFVPWLRVWGGRDGSIRHDLTGQAGWVQALAAAPDGTWLASAGSVDAVWLWDPRTGAAIRTLSRGSADRLPGRGRTQPGRRPGRIEVTTLAVASDGGWLAGGGKDGTVWIWDPQSGALRHTLIGHTEPVTRLAPAPDGSWLASAGHDNTVRIWDPDTGQARHTLTGHTGPLEALVAAPDGSWLASAGRDCTVQVWDPGTGRALHTLTAHTSVVDVLAVAPDGTWLASASYDYTVRLWDPRTGRPLAGPAGH
jgi:WD40 repeat protein